jgi:hypothetical protein
MVTGRLRRKDAGCEGVHADASSAGPLLGESRVSPMSPALLAEYAACGRPAVVSPRTLETFTMPARGRIPGRYERGAPPERRLAIPRNLLERSYQTLRELRVVTERSVPELGVV